VVLPQNSDYWRANAKNEPTIKIKSVTSATGAHYTFDAENSACVINTFLATGSGMDVINACRSSNAPVAEVSVPCGKSGEICCYNGSCNTGFSCSGGLCSPMTMPVPPPPPTNPGDPPPDPCTGAGSPCMMHPSGCANPNFQAKGTYQCKSQKLVCVVTQGTDYCAIAGGPVCGQAYGQPCGANNLCAPGMSCSYDSFSGKVICMNDAACSTPPGYCWNSNQLGVCAPSL